MSDTLDYRRARKGKPVNRGRKASAAEFRRMWADNSLTLYQIGEKLAIHQSTVSQRANLLGLPPRNEVITPIKPHRKIHDPQLCLEMLRFGVSVAEICAHFGISASGLKSFRVRQGEPARKRVKHPSTSKTVAEFKAAQAARALAARLDAEARQTRNAFILSEMVDRTDQRPLRLA